MSYTVEGMKITFGAETSGFDKGIKQVNKDLKAQKTISKGLKDVIKDTFDPKDLKTFDSQLNSLQTEFEGTEDKARALEKELKRMEDSGIKDKDVAQYRELQSELVKSKKESAKLTKEIEKTEKNIEAIKTENYTELSNEMKKAAIDNEKLTKEQVGWNKSADDGTKKGGLLSGAIGGLVSKFGPLEIATGAATAALAIFRNETEQNQQVVNTFGTSIGDINIPVKELEHNISVISRTMGIDFDTAVESSYNQMRLFGTTTSLVGQGLEDFQKTLALSNLEFVDFEEAINVIDKTMKVWGETTDQGIETVVRLNNVISDYGQAADDIVDSLTEYNGYWSSSAQFIKGNVLALEGGIRNTDVFNDSIKELTTQLFENSNQYAKVTEKMAAFSAEAEASGESVTGADVALSQINLSAQDLTDQMIDSGDAIGAFTSVFEGITNLEDPFDQLAVSSMIFGSTMTENLIPLYKTENATGSITEAIDILSARTNFATGLMTDFGTNIGLTGKELNNFVFTMQSGNTTLGEYILSNEKLTSSLQTQLTQAGLTKTEIDNLKFAMTEGGGSAIEYAKSVGAGAVLQQLLGKSLNLSKEQLASVSTAYEESGKIGVISLLAQSGAMKLLIDNNIISKETADRLTESINTQKQAYDFLNGTEEEQITFMKNLAEANNLNFKETNNLTGMVRALNNENATNKQITKDLRFNLDNLTRVTGLNEEANKNLAESLVILNDENATAEEKNDALSSAYNALASSDLVAVRKKTEELKTTYEKSKNPLKNLTGATEESGEAYANAASAAANGSTGIKDFANASSDARGPIQKLIGDVNGLNDSLYTTESAGAAAANGVNAASSSSKGGGLFGRREATKIQSEVIGNNRTIEPAQAPVVSSVGVNGNTSNVFNMELNIHSNATNPQELANDLLPTIRKELSRRL